MRIHSEFSDKGLPRIYENSERRDTRGVAHYYLYSIDKQGRPVIYNSEVHPKEWGPLPHWLTWA